MPNIGFSVMRDKLENGDKTQTIRPYSEFWMRREVGTKLIGFWRLRKPGESPRLFTGKLSEEPFVVKGAEFNLELAKRDGFELEVIEYPNGTIIQTPLAKMIGFFYDHYGDQWADRRYVVLRWTLIDEGG